MANKTTDNVQTKLTRQPTNNKLPAETDATRAHVGTENDAGDDGGVIYIAVLLATGFSRLWAGTGDRSKTRA
jgi:hypothetical protein